LEYSLPFNILFGIALSSILSKYPKHFILCGIINLTISSPFNNLFYLILHTFFPITGPYILRIIFLSNILSAFSSVTVSVHVSAPCVATCHINVLSSALDIILLLNILRFAK
jgi:ABC-type sulfate transport system permease subunit